MKIVVAIAASILFGLLVLIAFGDNIRRLTGMSADALAGSDQPWCTRSIRPWN